MPSPDPIPDQHQTTYSLYCTVCQNEHVNKMEWLKHLTEEEHLTLARKHFLLDWNTPSVKECCVVIFSGSPLTSKVVYDRMESFSNQTGNFLATDFVWWEDRPQIGILQFESSDKVRQFLNALKDDTHFQMDNLSGISFHLEGAMNLVELLWSAILPPRDITITSALRCPRMSGGNDDAKVPAVSSRKHACDSFPEQGTPLAKKRRTTNSHNTKSKSVEPIHIPMFLSDQLPPTVTPISHPLLHQFWDIRKSVIIPDTEYETATSAVKSLEMIFQNTFPKSKVVVLSNLWNLKLRDQNCGSEYNQLLLYLRNCNRKSTNGNTRIVSTAFKASQMRQVSGDPAVQQEFCLVKEKSTIQKWKVTSKPANVNMVIITGKEFKVQVQINRLSEYLLSFDSRCHHLLTLMLVWTNVNSIDFGGTEVKCLEETRSSYLPAHLTIQWLLIHYLCGKQYIPTPRKVLSRSRPHETIRDPMTGISIGFNADQDLVEKWKSKKSKLEYIPEDQSSDAFIFSVLKLFKNFLLYCYSKLGTQDDNEWIFNTQTGFSFTLDTFLEELEKLKISRTTSSRPKCKLHLTHPFLLNCKFPISKNITHLIKLFNVTGVKLGSFLYFMRDHGLSAAVTRYGTLENVLTIDSSIRDNIQSLIERERTD